MTDWHAAPIDDADRAMLRYVTKLTLTPHAMGSIDVDALRTAGFDDRSIHDIAQVTALFAYYNRLADGLGIDDEPDWAERSDR